MRNRRRMKFWYFYVRQIPILLGCCQLRLLSYYYGTTVVDFEINPSWALLVIIGIGCHHRYAFQELKIRPKSRLNRGEDWRRHRWRWICASCLSSCYWLVKQLSPRELIKRKPGVTILPVCCAEVVYPIPVGNSFHRHKHDNPPSMPWYPRLDLECLQMLWRWQ